MDNREEENKRRDAELGMNREITRRDFLNGVAVGTGAALLGGALSAQQLLAAGALDEFAPEKAPDYYPPARMGIRGTTTARLPRRIACATGLPRIPSAIPSRLAKHTISW